MDSFVYIYRCTGYNKKNIKEIISDYFKDKDLSGIFSGKKILIKPNMLQAHRPEENVTTHPLVVEAVAEYIKEHGGKCLIGDSPSGRGKENAMHAAEKSGFLAVCERQNIDFDFFDGQRLIKHEIKDGKVYKHIFLPESYSSYDIVMNIPKLKTHAFTTFTLGIKNMFGMVVGNSKADTHRRAPDPKHFADAICDIYSAVVPDYTILDAIEGMDGQGPVTGKTKKLNRIFISDDANALDSAVISMCGFNPHKSIINKKAAERGLGLIEPKAVKNCYEGTDEEFKRFKIPAIPAIVTRIPSWLVKILSLFLSRKPVINISKCSTCGNCIDICPAEAISYCGKYPAFDLKKCIRCFCCIERCENGAISEKSNRITKLLS
ncbi:MAG: DUF362 domain-containing protein [Elusimicrobiota bacterium]